MDSNTVGSQCNLHKFEAIHKKNEGRSFSLTSARVPTCPAGGESWHMLKIH
jgi:hypothetical protein